MYASAIVFHDGRIIDTASIDFKILPNNRVEITHSSYYKPCSFPDQFEIVDLSEIKFIRPWSLHDPDIYSSLARIIDLAMNAWPLNGSIINHYRCKGLEL